MITSTSNPPYRSRIWILAANELRQELTWSRLGSLVMFMLLGLLMFFLWRDSGSGLHLDASYYTAQDRAYWSLQNLVEAMAQCFNAFCMLARGDFVSSGVDQRLLEPLLASSMKRWDIVLGKYAAVMVLTLAATAAQTAVLIFSIHAGWYRLSPAFPSARLIISLSAVVTSSGLALSATGLAFSMAGGTRLRRWAISSLWLTAMVVLMVATLYHPSLWPADALFPLTNGYVGIRAVFSNVYSSIAVPAGVDPSTILFPFHHAEYVPIMLVVNMITVPAMLMLAVRNLERRRLP